MTREATFEFQGKTYEYAYPEYHPAWDNERAVELPIIWDFYMNSNAEKVLEIGNVLSHNYQHSHDVVDKYEEEEGVINEDIVSYDPPAKYDLIISISTLEHVGYDENGECPEKFYEALENIQRLLAQGGEFIMTAPLGYNPIVDRFFRRRD